MKKSKRIMCIALSALTAGCVLFGGSYAEGGFVSTEVNAAASAESRVELNCTKISLGVGESSYLSAKVPAGDSIKKWTTSDPNVVTVNQGCIKAVSEGKARVAVRTVNGVVAVCNVTVKSAPSYVRLNTKELNIGLGESYSLSYYLPNGTASHYAVFTSNNRGVVSCDTKGNLTGISEGTADVKVVLFNRVYASCRVTVKKAPTGASFGVSKIELGEGENYKLSVKLSAGSASKFRNYTVLNPDVLSCDDKGNLKALKLGVAIVTLQLFNGVISSCRVNVKKAPDSVKFRTDSLTLGAGEKYTLTAELPEDTASALEYSSDNEKVLTVGKSGLVTAKNPGTANVTVKLYNGVSAKCSVTVKKAPSSAYLNKNELTMDIGDKQKLVCYVPEDNASYHVNFVSDNPEAVSCDKFGNITAVSAGTANITASMFNGVKVSCRVTVEEEIEYIVIDKDLAVLDVGQSAQINARTPEGVVLASAKYSSADKSVATVSSSGVIKAVAPGNTNIIVKSGDKTSKVGVIVYGNKYYSTYPSTDETESIMNTAKLSPKKTNCKALDDLVGSIISRITNSSMTTGQKVRACYDYLSQNCVYGYGYIPTPLPGNYNYSSDYFIVTMAYPILVNNVGTCENYAAAFTVMMRRLGLDADVVYGQVGLSSGGKGGHYWTNITVNNKHYVFDTQVEHNTLGYNRYVNHYWYGMKPEHNYRMYEYKEFLRARDFSYS